jgi:hypothetical protein
VFKRIINLNSLWVKNAGFKVSCSFDLNGGVC